MIKARSIAAMTLLAMFGTAPLFITPLGAEQLTDRAKEVGGKFMCVCGCNQVLTGCNHVNCPSSVPMLKELSGALARGDSEDAITQMFVQEFGTKVYAEPPKTGFSLVAWVFPKVCLLVGAGLVVFVIARWRKRPAPLAAPAGSAPGISAEMLERARAQASRETQD
jgi:cytochrome c-type biogenesis protein CcmH